MIPLGAGIGFALGLAGGLHCAGMCGPIVLAMDAPVGGVGARRRLLLHAAYHAGRVVTYALLGLAAGALGGVVSWLARWESAAALVSGVLMLATAIFMAGALRRPQLVQIGPAAWLTRGAAGMMQSPSPLRKLWMGLMMGWLPCGMVYAALLAAASTAGAIEGAVLMAEFGVATSLPLLAIGLASTALGAPVRRWSPKLAPLAIALLGAVLIWRGLNSAGVAPHVHHH
jgi:hypothetical protein